MSNADDYGQGVSDPALLRVMGRAIDTLERQIDCVAERPLRLALNQRIIEIRMLARDGHLRNMNGGKGPNP